MASMKDANPMVRSASIRALESQVQRNNAAIEKALPARLSDPVRSVRIDAAWALRAILETNSGAGIDLVNQLRHNADQPAGALQLGVFFLDRGDIGASLVWLERAVRWDTNSAPLHHEFAIGLSKAGRMEEAIRELETACSLAPREAEYRFKLALALNEKGDADGARQALQEAVKLDPKFARAWYNLGLAHNSAGQTDEALKCLIRAESIDAESALIPYARATILARLGRVDEARKAVRRALELQPDFPAAKELMGSLSE
jgi:Flp pilus assembly protein TadD